jgi:hypothetical protein
MGVEMGPREAERVEVGTLPCEEDWVIIKMGQEEALKTEQGTQRDCPH